MKRFLLFISVLTLLCSCGDKGRVLPSVSGKAGEVLVVIDKSLWEAELGEAVRETLGGECPWLAVSEPRYTLANVAPGGFADMFKVHRNILIFNINPQVQEAGLKHVRDVWSSPQCVLQISAADAAEAEGVLRKNLDIMLSTIEQAERDRVISGCIRYEDRNIGPQVTEIFGGSPHFPNGYKMKKRTEDFIWIADEKQYTMQGVFIYSFPATGSQEDLSGENIISHRNAALKANVPGMFEGTYMTTAEFFEPRTEYIKYRKREIAQTRGYWEVKNDFMGGPFVNHSFYSTDGSRIISVDAFVYAPKYDKRQYLRQVESIIYSWEWKK